MLRTARVLGLWLLFVPPIYGADSEGSDRDRGSLEEPGEALLKSEYIERFTRFVEWPEAPESAAFVIGVIGDGRVRSLLEELARAGRFRNSRTVVRRVRNEAAVDGIRLLYIGSSATEEVDEILSWVDRRPILTIGDAAGLASHGVMINFFREGEYLRFEINVKSVAESGLVVSSRLLRLAREVK